MLWPRCGCGNSFALPAEFARYVFEACTRLPSRRPVYKLARCPDAIHDGDQLARGRILNWFHIAMKFQAAQRSVFGSKMIDSMERESVETEIIHAKWLAWQRQQGGGTDQGIGRSVADKGGIRIPHTVVETERYLRVGVLIMGAVGLVHEIGRVATELGHMADTLEHEVVDAFKKGSLSSRNVLAMPTLPRHSPSAYSLSVIKTCSPTTLPHSPSPFAPEPG